MIIIALCAILCGALAGYGAGGIVDQIRVMNINSVFGNREAGVPFWARGLAIPAGVLGCVAAGAFYAKLTQGRNIMFPITTLVFSGVTIGMWIAVLTWAPADAIGMQVDPTFHHDTPWGPFAWVMFTAQWWLPGILTLIAVWSIVEAVRVWNRRRKARLYG